VVGNQSRNDQETSADSGTCPTTRISTKYKAALSVPSGRSPYRRQLRAIEQRRYLEHLNNFFLPRGVHYLSLD
jgi:hypothetical protein